MTRVHVCGGGLRALLIADVARRTAQLSGRQVAVSWAFDEPRAAEFNIHPPDDVTVEHPSAGLLVNCPHTADSLQVEGFSADLNADPLSLRLALLDSPLREPAVLDAAGTPGAAVPTVAAEAMLRRWRSAVALWARSPGAPLSRRHVETAMAALARFDSPRAIEVLRSVEADNQIAPGTKFETFAYLDRVIGVDLARDLGS